MIINSLQAKPQLIRRTVPQHEQTVILIETTGVILIGAGVAVPITTKNHSIRVKVVHAGKLYTGFKTVGWGYSRRQGRADHVIPATKLTVNQQSTTGVVQGVIRIVRIFSANVPGGGRVKIIPITNYNLLYIRPGTNNRTSQPTHPIIVNIIGREWFSDREAGIGGVIGGYDIAKGGCVRFLDLITRNV